MKSEKGITLVSIAMYVIVVIIVTGILAVVTTTYGQNILKMNKEGTSNAEIDRFNMYFLREVKTEGNEISSISDDKNEITFTTGNKYTFNQDNNNIYLNNDIEIASNIEKCTFESKLENGKTIVIVTIKAEDTEEKSTEYVLANQEIASSYENELNYVHEEANSELKIGDYVDYTPDSATYPVNKLGLNYTGSTNNPTKNLATQTELKWRILEIDKNGCLTIISDKPTSTKVYFQGAKGYNNGVYILNDICKTLYSSTDLGVSARSLTIEDVEAGFSQGSQGGIEARDKYTNVVQYGKPKTYTGSNAQYPAIYAEENGSGIGVEEANQDQGRKTDGIGGSVEFYKEEQLTQKTDNKESLSADNLTCTQTYYGWRSTPATYCKNSKFYEMIFSTSTYYWLASRYVNCNSSCAYFGLRIVNSTNLDSSNMFYSNGNAYNSYNYLRPTIFLGPDVKVTKCSGENGPDNPHHLSK